jgi:NADH:ubiquinone oxidoreductase subunit 6 (subunit J)
MWPSASVLESMCGNAACRTSRDFGPIEQIGGLFFRRFVFPFELTGVLLLAAMVGAVVLAKRKV